MLVIRGAYIRVGLYSGAYMRDFTVFRIHLETEWSALFDYQSKTG